MLEETEVVEVLAQKLYADPSGGDRLAPAQKRQWYERARTLLEAERAAEQGSGGNENV
jgi:hypothetical protein